MKNLLVMFLILQCHLVYSDVTLKSGKVKYIFPEKYAAHFEEFESDREVNILFQVKGYRIISVQTGYLDFDGDLYHDGFANKMYLVNNRNRVLDYYEKPLGYLKASYQRGPFFVVTDYYTRGGSGGKDYSGFLNIFKIKNNSFVSLFSQNISYLSDFSNSEEYIRVGHFSIDTNKSQLFINISSSKDNISINEILEDNSYGDGGGDIKFVDSLALKDIKNTIAIDLSQENDKSIVSKLIKSIM